MQYELYANKIGVLLTSDIFDQNFDTNQEQS